MPPRDVGAVSCSPANKDQDEDAFDAFFFFFFAEKLKKKKVVEPLGIQFDTRTLSS